LLCQYVQDYHIQLTAGKNVGPIIEVIKQFLREFPNSKHCEALEWQLFKLETEPYEYEGDVPMIESSIKYYEGFLAAHPVSQYREEAQLQIALLSRMAYESIAEGMYPAKVGGVKIDPNSKTYTESDGQEFIDRAKKIYKRLLDSENVKTRERARVAQYNIRHGRRGYVNSNDW